MAKRRKKRQLSKEQKLAILKEHLVDNVAVTDLCKKHEIQPSLYYSWQKLLFERGGLDAIKNGAVTPEAKKMKEAERRIKALENRVQKKNQIMAELMEEHIILKKNISGEC